MNEWSMIVGGLLLMILGLIIIKINSNGHKEVRNDYRNRLKCEMIAKNECLYNKDWKNKLKCEKKVFNNCMKMIEELEK